MSERADRALGMHRRITRRDFLNGVGVTLTGSIAYPWFATATLDQTDPFAPEKSPDYYPPARTGLRGTHDGAWETAHALRDGKTWDDARDTGEVYDLVVVGGGISGLAAAYFYRKAAGRNARILVLDNHDDFGGHAKRNEFTSGGRTIVGYGGTQAIEGRRNWSPVARGLRDELGIDTQKFFTAFDPKLYTALGLGQGVFFDKETWTIDRLVKGGQGNPAEGPAPPRGWWRPFAANAPFSEMARKDFVRIHEERVDYLPGLSVAEKRARLRKLSYSNFLRDYAKVDAQVIQYFQQRTHSGWGVGIDAIPASGATWLAGFQGMGLAPQFDNSDPYIFHFPDGNASIARLLVRAMIPAAAPGTTMEDIVTARFNYASLDDSSSPVRLRLNSTAVRTRHLGDPATAKEVEVTYVRGGMAHRVRGKACVLACYNAIIPRLAPELSARQREGLLYGVKTPLVYTNVLIRNWRAFVKLGVSHVYSPSAYYALMFLDFPVNLGRYRGSHSPDDAIVLHHVRVPCKPGLPRRDQHRAGRGELLQTTFETFERRTRDQLGRMFGGGGFDPAKDIAAITVNRWPHGYADFGDPLTDPEWTTDEEKPWVIGRQRFGRIAIANSDAGHEAETQTAIDEAHRAVQELLGSTK
jgi:spermidine dehydrogenase